MTYHSVPRALHRFTVAQKRARREKIERLTEELYRLSCEFEELTPTPPDSVFDALEHLGNWLDHAK